MTALGGRGAVARRLDDFTRKLNVGPNEPYLWAGNEPGFAVPWLYNYVGQPWKSQLTVDRVRGLFGPTPDGEPGNDDLGAMASWYVWAALGLYPSTPGTSTLGVSAPLFDRAVIALPGGKSIRISAPGASAPNHLKYVSGLSIDGQATDHTWTPESLVRTGGDVKFSLVVYPDKAWGTADSAAPPSFGAGSSAVTVNVSQHIVTLAPGSTGAVTLDVQRMVDGAGGYAITGTSTHPGITTAPVSAQFGSDGSASVSVPITVARSVPEEYYLMSLDTMVGQSVAPFAHHGRGHERRQRGLSCPSDQVVLGEPSHHRPADEHRQPAGEYPVQQNRRHTDGGGQAEGGQAADQRRFDGAHAAGRRGGRRKRAADHRDHGDRDESRVAAERFDAGPQRQRRTRELFRRNPTGSARAAGVHGPA